MFRGIGIWEVLIVLAIILVLFGAARLPQMAHSLGRALTSFKKGLRDTADDVKEAIREDASEEDDPPKDKSHPADDADKGVKPE